MKNLTDLNKIKRKFENLSAKLKDVKLAYQCYFSNIKGCFVIDDDSKIVEDIYTASGGELLQSFSEIHSDFKTLSSDKFLKESLCKRLFVEIFIYDKNAKIQDYCDEALGCYCRYDDKIILDDDKIISKADEEIILLIAKLFF